MNACKKKKKKKMETVRDNSSLDSTYQMKMSWVVPQKRGRLAVAHCYCHAREPFALSVSQVLINREETI